MKEDEASVSGLSSLARPAPASAQNFQSPRLSSLPSTTALDLLISRRAFRPRLTVPSPVSPGASGSSNSIAIDWRCSWSVKRLLKLRR